MPQQIKIPILKNKGVIVGKKSHKRPFGRGLYLFTSVVIGFGLMLSLVWLKVETNTTLAEINELEKILNQNRTQNQKLQAEVSTLKSIGSIQEAAETKLGLQFLPRQDLIRVMP